MIPVSNRGPVPATSTTRNCQVCDVSPSNNIDLDPPNMLSLFFDSDALEIGTRSKIH